jgi:hypothetical protein
MARSAQELWALHDLLQSLRALATGIWDQIMEALAAAHDGAAQIVDTSRPCVCTSMEPASRATETTHGPVARPAYEQDSWTPMPTRATRPRARRGS